ncbi:MAG: hypothetical protein R3F43_12890 [bacterium]
MMAPLAGPPLNGVFVRTDGSALVTGARGIVLGAHPTGPGGACGPRPTTLSATARCNAALVGPGHLGRRRRPPRCGGRRRYRPPTRTCVGVTWTDQNRSAMLSDPGPITGWIWRRSS